MGSINFYTCVLRTHVYEYHRNHHYRSLAFVRTTSSYPLTYLFNTMSDDESLIFPFDHYMCCCAYLEIHTLYFLGLLFTMYKIIRYINFKTFCVCIDNTVFYQVTKDHCLFILSLMFSWVPLNSPLLIQEIERTPLPKCPQMCTVVSSLKYTHI